MVSKTIWIPIVDFLLASLKDLISQKSPDENRSSGLLLDLVGLGLNRNYYNFNDRLKIN